MRSLAGVVESSDREKQRYDLFTVRSNGRRVEEGWVNLHLLVWKQLVATLVRMETEGEAFARANVWRPAWKRFEKKACALAFKARQAVLRAEDRGEEERDVSGRGAPLWPIGTITKEGSLLITKEGCEEVPQRAP